METDKQLVDYEVEAKKLEEFQSRPPFWNPKDGKFTVVFLGELEHYEYSDAEEKIQKRARVDIEVAQQKYTWSFGIGLTKASLYGQIIDFAKKNNNKLTGTTVTVVIKYDGKKRDFTLV